MGLIAAEVHRRFTARLGSEQIASQFAIAGLLWWCRRQMPGTILEVGSGIGTLTSILAEAIGEGLLVSVEDNDWCRTQTLFTAGVLPWKHIEKPWLAASWALVVIDGGEQRDDYYANLVHHGVVFFEGNRRIERAILEDMWQGGRRFCKANWRPPDRSKGYWIYLFEPTVGERVWFAAVRLLEWLRDAPVRLQGYPVGKRRR